MKTSIFSLVAITVVLLAFSSCQKDSDKSGEEKSTDYFYLTNKAGKKYSATYQATSVTSGNVGVFNFKEIKPSTSSNYYFYSFKMNFDASSTAVMEIKLSSPPQLGITYQYTTASGGSIQSVLWDVTLDNTVYSSVKGDVTFTAFAVPGRVKGTARAFNTTNGEIATSEFDFVVK